MDQFDILQTLGRGSFGVVRKVRRRADNKTLVVKEMDYGAADDKQKEQIVAEVNILRELRHPFIVRYYDRIVDRKRTRLHIVMEHCSTDLARVLRARRLRGEYLEEPFLWNLFCQVVVALEFCHGRVGKGGVRMPIIHRDLKPENVFLTDDNVVKLGDFGLAKELSGAQLAETSVGTPYYMSPELINEQRYDERTDVWSLGCLMYEAAALSRPFNAHNQLALAMKINNGKIAPLPSRYSSELFAAIQWMLNKARHKRPRMEDLVKVPRLQLPLRENRLLVREFQLQQSYVHRLQELKTRESEVSRRESELAVCEGKLRRRTDEALAQERQQQRQQRQEQQQHQDENKSSKEGKEREWRVCSRCCGSPSPVTANGNARNRSGSSSNRSPEQQHHHQHQHRKKEQRQRPILTRAESDGFVTRNRAFVDHGGRRKAPRRIELEEKIKGLSDELKACGVERERGIAPRKLSEDFYPSPAGSDKSELRQNVTDATTAVLDYASLILHNSPPRSFDTVVSGGTSSSDTCNGHNNRNDRSDHSKLDNGDSSDRRKDSDHCRGSSHDPPSSNTSNNSNDDSVCSNKDRRRESDRLDSASSSISNSNKSNHHLKNYNDHHTSNADRHGNKIERRIKNAPSCSSFHLNETAPFSPPRNHASVSSPRQYRRDQGISNLRGGLAGGRRKGSGDVEFLPARNPKAVTAAGRKARESYAGAMRTLTRARELAAWTSNSKENINRDNIRSGRMKGPVPSPRLKAKDAPLTEVPEGRRYAPTVTTTREIRGRVVSLRKCSYHRSASDVSSPVSAYQRPGQVGTAAGVGGKVRVAPRVGERRGAGGGGGVVDDIAAVVVARTRKFRYID